MDLAIPEHPSADARDPGVGINVRAGDWVGKGF